MCIVANIQVRFVDKNFNGLGQRLSLSLSAREEIDADKIDASSTKLLEELNTDPIHECTWEDWSIDGESISVGIKRDYARDMRYRLSKRSSLVGGVTVKTIVDSAFAKWTRSCLRYSVQIESVDVFFDNSANCSHPPGQARAGD